LLEFQRVEEVVRSYEVAEVAIGDLAMRPASERRMTGEVRAMAQELKSDLNGKIVMLP